jgi:hypothetical protein
MNKRVNLVEKSIHEGQITPSGLRCIRSADYPLVSSGVSYKGLSDFYNE